MRFLLIFLLLLVPAGHASAVFYNNTETIEIGDGELPEASPDSTNDTGVSGGGSGSGSSSGGGSTGGGGGGTIPSDNGSGNQSSTEDNSTNDAEDVLDTLISAGALSGIKSSTIGGAQGAGGESGFSIRIIGAKVRNALYANFDLKEILSYWRKGKGKANDAELGLIAASTALRDANVQEIAFTASSFEIVYRSRGYLLAVIPWSFPVRLTVVPEAPVVEERVRVKLPWYRFFVRKFFTVKGLQRDVDALITKTKENAESDADGTVLLFEATAEFLRKKVGTVADSVLLGVEPQ